MAVPPCLFFPSRFILTLVIRRIATRLKILDYPEERKIHEQPIPLLGGLAVYIAYVAAIFLNFSFSAELKGVILGGTVILVVGLVDDIKKLSATWKLMAQILAAGILIYYGVRLSFLPNNWWGIGGEILLTVIWVVGITNAVNFFDGMDGLATGSIAICCLSFFIVALLTNQPYLGYLTIALAGSCLAFLIFNFKPASIFLITACLGISGLILRATGDIVIYFEILQALLIFAIIVILMRTGRRSDQKE